MVDERGKRRHDKGRTRFEEEIGDIDEMLWQGTEGGHIQDLVMEIAQGASVTDADDGGPPWSSRAAGRRAWPQRPRPELK